MGNKKNQQCYICSYFQMPIIKIKIYREYKQKYIYNEKPHFTRLNKNLLIL